MRYMRLHTIVAVLGLAVLFCFGVPINAFCAALTPSETYTITVEAVRSNGTTASLGLSTTSVADADGKIAFSFSGLPTTDSYNFLVVTVKDSGDSTVRQSIVPAPSPGGTVNLGVSPMTKTQTEAMLSALQTAGSDDPVLILFGGIIIRTGGFSSDDITHLANIARLGIISGFNPYLLSKVGATKMATFKSAIVTGLASYTSLLKDAVDATSDAAAKNERGEAAALLSQILIDAADQADIQEDYINAAMKAASDQVETYLGGDGSGMNEAAVVAMDAVMASNYMKLRAEALKKKYTNALTTLGASSAQVARFNSAVNTLSATLIAAFQDFESVFEDEEAGLNAGDIDSAFGDIGTAINAAYGQFMTDTASTDAEIQAMLDAMETGFAMAAADLNTMKGDGRFKYWDNYNSALVNWPITMVVPVTWVAQTHGNNLDYTRDTLAIPAAMKPANGGWLAARTNFTAVPGMQDGMTALMGLREDVEIIVARKWAALAAASRDMTTAGYLSMSAADKTTADGYEGAGNLTIIGGSDDDGASQDFDDGSAMTTFDLLEDLAPYLTGEESQGIEELIMSNLSARSDDISVSAGAITDAQKDALVVLAAMPDFH
jgi:hypothetical protein